MAHERIRLAQSEWDLLDQEMARRLAEAAPKPNPPQRDVLAMKNRLVRRRLERQFEGLNLYEDLPLANDLHRCNSVWRLATGANRSSKTVTASTEGGRALTGADPYDKYPKTNGRALFVGLKLEIEVARIYRALCCPGLFKIIQDEHTRMWRAVRYDRNNPQLLQEYDLAYREKWRDAPPLIPPRLIGNIAWEDRAKDVPRLITLRTGWKAIFLSSMGKPEQGEHYNFVFFDEEMPNAEFYREAHRGLVRLHEPICHRPKGIWAATAQLANPEFAELRDKAEADPDSDFIRQFIFLVDNNPYITPEARKEFYDGLSEADRQTRYFGVPAIATRYVYGSYKPMGNSADGSGHGCEPFEIDSRLFTRYVIIDPSVTRCAILFVAVDKQEQYMTVYDGITLSKCTARMAAAAVKQKQGDYCFEAGVLDQRMGRESLNSRVKTTVANEYFQGMLEAGVQFRQRGPLQGWFPGCDNVDTRTQALLSMMEVRGWGPFAGTCKLRIMRGRVPYLDKEISRAVTDPKNPNKRFKNADTICDGLDTLEYAAAGKLGYRQPEAISPEETSPVFAAFQEKQRGRYAVA